jgi:hypothetical protein
MRQCRRGIGDIAMGFSLLERFCGSTASSRERYLVRQVNVDLRRVVSRTDPHSPVLLRSSIGTNSGGQKLLDEPPMWICDRD